MQLSSRDPKKTPQWQYKGSYRHLWHESIRGRSRSMFAVIGPQESVLVRVDAIELSGVRRSAAIGCPTEARRTSAAEHWLAVRQCLKIRAERFLCVIWEGRGWISIKVNFIHRIFAAP